MLTCKNVNCGAEILDGEERCSTCGRDAGFPNVRAAEREEEISALEKRYTGALKCAERNGTADGLRNFDEHMKRSFAVINLNLDFLHLFITNNKTLYSNYNLSVRGQMRRLASGRDDRRRRTIEASIFGGYAEQIRYGALSLDGAGPKSYGPYAMRMKEVAVCDRATLLEDNSYNFISRHGMQPGEDIPTGYRATWKERSKLAVSKLGGRISFDTPEDEYPKILLSSDGDRETEDFVEVHIYGPFDNNAVDSVMGNSNTKKSDERAYLAIIKEHLARAGKRWVEA